MEKTEKSTLINQKIKEIYTYSITREEALAQTLNHHGITEEDLLKLRDKIELNYPTVIAVANIMRDIERKNTR